jgi:hypothetical protein
MKRVVWMIPALALACSDVEGDDDHHHHGQEVITTVALALTPVAGGDTATFIWTDPEADGNPVIDGISLAPETSYTLTVSFLNGLEDPPEDLTPEIRDESDEHQVFFTGSGVQGPATGPNGSAVVTQAYGDSDENGLPVGLENDFASLTAGTGDLTLTLRHLPEQDGNAVKVAVLAAQVAENGMNSIGGETDVMVTFPVEVK